MSEDSSDAVMPQDPRRHRQRRLVLFLRTAVVVVAIMSAADLIVPEPWQGALGVGVIVVLVAVPLVRVAWLVQRWFRRGDLRFAAVGVALLGIAALGALLA